ncbi:MAG: zinc ribbon domain-containing protein, partial [Pseudomonadota bacterium]|nr:zinc ribbon domain-containing protein [Pseudomonadota bacterium]
FGAAIGLWWTSVSLIDLAPYIYDALRPQLILLGGSVGEDGPHDWIYLLDSFGQRPNAQHWGTLAHTLGGLVMFAALSWASAVLWRQRLKLSESLNAN